MAAEDNFKKMRDLVLHSYSGGMVVNYSHLAHAVGSSFEKKIRPLGSASRAVFRLKINDCWKWEFWVLQHNLCVDLRDPKYRSKTQQN